MCFKYKSYNEDYSTNDDEEKSQIEYDIKNIFKSEKKARLKYYSLSLMGGKKISKGHSEKNLASI